MEKSIMQQKTEETYFFAYFGILDHIKWKLIFTRYWKDQILTSTTFETPVDPGWLGPPRKW